MPQLTLNVELERPDFSLSVSEELELEGITAIFGASGAGKTTLLRVIAGLERGARGRVALDGVPWQDDVAHSFVPAHKRNVGYVFQEGRLFEHLTVLGNLRFATRQARRGIDGHEVIRALDLEPLLGRKPQSLSAGERQRVAIARALVRGPALLLMDEPLSSLDLSRKREIVPYIERLPEAFGLAVLYVTHNLEELARIANRMLLLHRGRVAARGAVKHLLERIDLAPLTGELSAGTLIEAVVRTHEAGTTLLEFGRERLRIPMLDTPIGTRVRIRIEARDVALATTQPTGLSIRNVLPASILGIETDDSGHAEVLLEVGGQHVRARITQHALRELGLAVGQSVYALIKSVAFEGHLLG
jgi:molybdate transport system ATP-binding protein